MIDIFYPIQLFAEWLTLLILGTKESALAESLKFFFYDSIKIVILLFVMIFIMGVLGTYIPKHKIKQWLGGKKKFAGNFLAAGFGAITPFCSCSSIPLFMSFIEAGIPLGTAFSFLITSPMINEYLVVIMFGFFGWKITALYIISGLLIGTISGIVLGKMSLEKYLIINTVKGKVKKQKEFKKIEERFSFGCEQAKLITKNLWLWIFAGVGIGAIIHGFIPEEFIKNAINQTGIFNVPIAVAIGIPLYANCAAIVPVAVALFHKGIPLGTALAFMMATAALSFPEAIILKKVMKTKLLLIFFAIVAMAIIITGYVFNFLVLL